MLAVLFMLGCVAGPGQPQAPDTPQQPVNPPGPDNRATPGGPPMPPGSSGKLSALQQTILYDRRGGKWDDVLEYRQLMLVNSSAGPVSVAVSRQLAGPELQRLDTQSFFTFMTDLAPAGVTLPADALIRKLPAPRQEQAVLRWSETNVKPGEAALAYYSGYRCKPSSLVQADTVNLPQASVRSQGSRAGDSINLKYTVKNTCMVPVQKIRLTVFLPDKIPSAPAGEPDVALYSITQTAFDPKPEEVISNTMTTDGNLALAQGTLIRFTCNEIKPGAEAVFSARVVISATGKHGEAAPYVHFNYYAYTGEGAQFAVKVISPADSGVVFAPSASICNLGWPDTTRFSF